MSTVANVDLTYHRRLGESVSLSALGAGVWLWPHEVGGTPLKRSLITLLREHQLEPRDIIALRAEPDRLEALEAIRWPSAKSPKLGPYIKGSGHVLDRRACSLVAHVQTPEGAAQLQRAGATMPPHRGEAVCSCVAARRRVFRRWADGLEVKP